MLAGKNAIPCCHFSECIVCSINEGRVGSNIPIPILEKVIAPANTTINLTPSDKCLGSLKRQPHEGENLDERIVTIPCKRVYGATQAHPCETIGCSRQRFAVEVSNKTHLFRGHEQLRYPAKNCLCCHWLTL